LFRDDLSAPDLEIYKKDSIAYGQSQQTIKLRLLASDSLYNLDRFNVWVNEVPLFGQRGIRYAGKNNLDTVIVFSLSEGENRIESSVINSNGTESFRSPLLVHYQPPAKAKPKLYFIGIGIDDFADKKFNLEYSTKDIIDLSRKLKSKFGSDILIDTLFNANVTVGNIRRLKQKLKTSGVDDKVIVSYSGHGLLNKNLDYFLSTYNINFEKPEENGLPYDELENLLDSIPARRKLLLIDACHSGEVDKEDLVALDSMVKDLHLIKGLKPVGYKNEKGLGLKNSFELMQSLFVNVGKTTGATIISAAAGTQFALERNDLRNGVFTYCILEALEKNKTMKVSALRNYVSQRVFQLTNGMQQPTSRNEMISVDWDLW
jgi:hypothetical protein